MAGGEAWVRPVGTRPVGAAPATLTDPSASRSVVADPSAFDVLTVLGVVVTVLYLLALVWWLGGYGAMCGQVQARVAVAVWRATRWWCAGMVGLATTAVCLAVGWDGPELMPLAVAGGIAVGSLPWPGSRRATRRANLRRAGVHD